MEHDADGGHIVETDEGSVESLVVTSEPPEATHPGKGALDYPTTWQQHKPSLGFGQLHYLQLDAVFLGRLGRCFSCVSLIHERYLYTLSCFLLHGLSKLCYLSSLLLVGRSRVHREQMSQSIYCHMHLRPFPPLVPVVSGSLSTLWSRLQRATIKDSRSWLRVSAFSESEHHSQVVDHSLETAGLNPAMSLLVDCMPGRQIVSHHPPGGSCPYYPPESTEHFPQRVFPLWSIFGHQRQVRCDEAPLLVADITRVRFTCLHTIILPTRTRKVHNTL